MLLDDAGVLDGHVPAAEGDHARAGPDVGGVQRRALQGGVRLGHRGPFLGGWVGAQRSLLSPRPPRFSTAGARGAGLRHHPSSTLAGSLSSRSSVTSVSTTRLRPGVTKASGTASSPASRPNAAATTPSSRCRVARWRPSRSSTTWTTATTLARRARYVSAPRRGGRRPAARSPRRQDLGRSASTDGPTRPAPAATRSTRPPGSPRAASPRHGRAGRQRSRRPTLQSTDADRPATPLRRSGRGDDGHEVDAHAGPLYADRRPAGNVAERRPPPGRRGASCAGYRR